MMSWMGGNDDEQPADDDDDDGLDLGELSHVLTVTAKKLAGMTLGRKFTTKKPQTSQAAAAIAAIAKKKANSHCAACGQKGQWKGDAACSMSTTSRSSSSVDAKGDRPPKPPQSAGGQKSRAFTVVHHDHGSLEVTNDDEYGNMFQCMMVNGPQFMVHEVQAFSPTDFVGKLIIDSGCQRNCCGMDWYQGHIEKLSSEHGLQPITIACDDSFQFGKGKPQVANYRSYIPTGVSGMRCFLLGTAVLDAKIPLLGSHSLLQDLEAIINLPEKKIHLLRLKVTLPLVLVSGHLAIEIDEFPKDVPPEVNHVGRSLKMKVFGRNQIQTVFSHGFFMLEAVKTTTSICWKLTGRQVQFRTNKIRSLLMLSTPPQWLVHWRSVVNKIYNFQKNLFYQMVIAVRLGMMPRSWLQEAVPPHVTLKNHPDRCDHQSIRRHGNAHGRFALCQECGMKWKWDNNLEKLLYTKLLYTVATIAIDSNSLQHGKSGSQVQEEAQGKEQSYFGDGGHSSTTHRGLDPSDWFGGSVGTSCSQDLAFDLESQLLRPRPLNDRGRSSNDEARHDRQHGPLCSRQPGGDSKGDGYQQKDSRDLRQPQSSGPALSNQLGRGRGLRLGAGRRLRNNVKKAAETLEAENMIYQALPTVSQRPPPCIDVLEIFSGASKFTLRCKKFGLNALEPIDIEHGDLHDLKDEKVRNNLKQAIKRFKPWLVILGVDCRFWNQFNINLNY